jgi:hypothetical protein
MNKLPDRIVDGVELLANERRYIVKMGERHYDVIEMQTVIDVLRWDGTFIAGDCRTMRAAINAIRRDVARSGAREEGSDE